MDKVDQIITLSITFMFHFTILI